MALLAAQETKAQLATLLSGQVRVHWAPSSQVILLQGGLAHVKAHALVGLQSTAQLPLPQLKSQWLPPPQVQAEPAQSPLQVPLPP
jgi:hypothetical protein